MKYFMITFECQTSDGLSRLVFPIKGESRFGIDYPELIKDIEAKFFAENRSAGSEVRISRVDEINEVGYRAFGGT